ncbi:hypothetical protein DPMN_191539 [Dreissena polymorpha]|uniref:Uncharacterized protein n=1 Tax=Dreissena polymorpha TaxID=45954 RepID=A0A9D3Y584_DREPO|nr:hypothetical protein DPMN_191539 [Dreissena polymorpha]
MMEAQQSIPRHYTPDMWVKKLETPRPNTKTPSLVYNTAPSPAILDSLPTIDVCRQRKGIKSVSSSSSPSYSSGKTSCEGYRGILKELESIHCMLRSIKHQPAVDHNYGQSRRSNQFSACTGCPDACCCLYDTAQYANRDPTADSRRRY